MERRSIHVSGIVQGVGFRPFVYALATRLGLTGFVVNDAGEVEIEIEGDAASLAAFERDLSGTAPPLSRIETIATRPLPVRDDTRFRIVTSITHSSSSVFVSPDTATCATCLRELADPADRRYRYPFINCTACGPRLTIVTGSPYDRERTTMAPFAMCGACRAEYENPADRRFHAEPIACAACGPRLKVFGADRQPILEQDPITLTGNAILNGQIVAIKGLGGFHLGCDASNATAVDELRRRKHRDEKPFAVMVGSLEHAQRLCEVSPAEEALLGSPARPIVLLRRRPAASTSVVGGVAPGNGWLGLLLPYTPLHYLLMAALSGKALLLTSGNRSDEPIATDNADAISRLAGIADLFLLHDRAIHVRCDDSVVRVSGTGPMIIRRSRGYAPAPITLPLACAEPILAVGGQLKNTFAIGVGSHVFLSHHIGDLDDLRARDAFERDLELFERLFEVRPRLVAHDGHPDYASTRLAIGRPGATLFAVQHHHAHVASCMAENGVTGPVIGISWDGAGWGPDGAVWGGEFLVGDYHAVQRAAHFRYVPLPGGDRAAKEPWRMLLSHLDDAQVEAEGLVPASVGPIPLDGVRRMIERGINSPMTSSIGRLFDAVAALCGGPPVTSFEGQAAMWLESLAEQGDGRGSYPLELAGSGPCIIDTRPLFRAAAADRRAGVPPPEIARKFHATLVRSAVEVACDIRRQAGIGAVALSGGVFLNEVLSRGVEETLASLGFAVYRHRLVPPGDGGLCLGQLAIAAAHGRAQES